MMSKKGFQLLKHSVLKKINIGKSFIIHFKWSNDFKVFSPKKNLKADVGLLQFEKEIEKFNLSRGLASWFLAEVV